MRGLVVALLVATGCNSFFAPDENPSQTVEGCNKAVTHLRQCCPKWDSYISCTFLITSTAQPDLTPGQSECLAKKPCDTIVRAVTSGSNVCGFSPASRSCR